MYIIMIKLYHYTIYVDISLSIHSVKTSCKNDCMIQFNNRDSIIFNNLFKLHFFKQNIFIK